MIRGVGVVLVAVLLAGCASQTTKHSVERRCFNIANVRNFDAISDTEVMVDAGRDGLFALELFNYCPDIEWSSRVHISTSMTGNSRVCVGDSAGVVVTVLDAMSTTGGNTCRVRRVSKRQDRPE